MTTKEICITKYQEYKATYNRIPKYDEYLKFSGIPKRHLIQLFGKDAYSHLQIECGDKASKLNLIRTSNDKIMRQYGDLSIELGRIPTTSDWIYKGYKPSTSGLEKTPHNIKWSEFPSKFKEWLEKENIKEYKKVLSYIEQKFPKTSNKESKEFIKVINEIKNWSPGRRRNSEGEYKIELRKYLESLHHNVKEEYGESNLDLLIDGKFAIEIKKDPRLDDYDRLFGQLARHLQHHNEVIALIMEPPTGDKLCNFELLADLYLNTKNKSVIIIRR